MKIRIEEVSMTESGLRELIRDIKREHPELIREIFCEDCPEHTGVIR